MLTRAILCSKSCTKVATINYCTREVPRGGINVSSEWAKLPYFSHHRVPVVEFLPMHYELSEKRNASEGRV